MPFGAHETLKAHEILSGKINMIDHFAFYSSQCQDPQLKSMLDKHLMDAVDAYNNLLSYTHTYHVSPANIPQMQPISPEQIKYGLRSPGSKSPQLSPQSFSDQQIAGSMQFFHKTGAIASMGAALESADPFLFDCMLNAAMACAREAYETFTYANQMGWYQVPTIDNRTAKTLLQSYQQAQPGQPQNQATYQQSSYQNVMNQMNQMSQNQMNPNQMNQNPVYYQNQGQNVDHFNYKFGPY